jgi:acyl carrier protein
MEESTIDKLMRIIVEQLGVDFANVTPESKIIEDLGGDSLDAKLNR